MLTLIIDEEYAALQPELQYVTDVYNSVYDNVPDLTLSYGYSQDGAISIIPADAQQFFINLETIPDQYCWFRWSGTKIPLLFQEEIPGEIVSQEDSIRIHGDILASAFYFLSCWQEIHSDTGDHLGRFPARESFLVRHNLLHIPVVNYYFDVLTTAVEYATGSRPTPVLSMNNKHALTAVITHDIDQCKTGWKQETRRALQDGKPLPALTALSRKLFSRDVWFNFDTILEIERQQEVPATFFFIPEHRKYGKHPNADYKIQSERILEVLEKIRQAGHEIGVHASLGTGWNETQLRSDLERFPGQVLGGRFHYLAFSLPDSFRVIESSGLHYDTSPGFSERVGFRSSICYPYRPYNPETRSAYSFYEFPLALMDWTFIGTEYMNLSPEEIYPYVETLLQEVQKFNGMFVVLWHNNSFSGYKFRGWDTPFLWLLQEVRNRSGRFALPGEVLESIEATDIITTL